MCTLFYIHAIIYMTRLKESIAALSEIWDISSVIKAFGTVHKLDGNAAPLALPSDLGVSIESLVPWSCVEGLDARP